MSFAMCTNKTAFVNPVPCPRQEQYQVFSNNSQTCSSKHVCCASRCSRRVMLRRSLLAVGSFLIGSSFSSHRGKTAAETLTESKDSVCKNCIGTGKVPCDLCSGTGFWRALSGSDPKQKYKGVICPECEGSGILTCPVCLGTGEGNVKGLLRRRRVEPGPGRVLQTN